MVKIKFFPPLLLVLLVATPVLARAETKEPRQGLVGALQAVMANHPAVLGKRAELDATKADLTSFKAARFPTLSAQAGYNDEDFKQAVLRAQQPLWAFGKITGPIRQSEAQLAVEQADLLRVQRELLEDTALAYARIEGIRGREEIAGNNVASHVRLFEQIERRFTGKLTSQADVMIASSRLTQARAELEQIRAEMRVALNNLESLTGEAVDAASPVPADLVRFPAHADIVPAILAASPDREVASREVEAARLSEKVQKVAATPTLYLTADHYMQDGLEGMGETRLSLNLEATLNGMGVAVYSRVKGARARTKAARQNLEYVKNDLRQRAANLVSDLQLQIALEKSRSDSVNALTETYASYERQYAAGHKAWLDLLNMQRELTQQKLQLAQAQNDILTISLRLATQMGGLDAPAGIESTGGTHDRP